MKLKAKWGLVAAHLSIVVAYSQITPYNSWRALVVYTNSIDSIYGGYGANLYKDYFASLFDDVNQVYEDSEIDPRAQIAGVIWDKTYAQYHSGTYPGCGNMGDLLNKTNGMGRYVDLMGRYAADVIVLVHNNSPGGCAFTFDQAKAKGYGGFWIRSPNNPRDFAHEMGHNYLGIKGNNGHCYGHRIALNAAGVSVDAVPHYWTLGNPETHEMPVVPDTVTIVSAFHTTMAYGNGGGCVDEVCKFAYQPSCHRYGLLGKIDTNTLWTGVFSNPLLEWLDTVTNTTHTLGYDSLTYFLPFIHQGDTVSVTTRKIPRNVSAEHQSRHDTIMNFKGVPENLTISIDMSLGTNASDSQWVYAHLVATNSVLIEPGFKIKEGSSLRISVGSSSGMLAKKGLSVPEERFAKNGAVESKTDARIKYDHAAQVLTFSIPSESNSGLQVSVYDLKGTRKVWRTFSQGRATFITEYLSVRDLPPGAYLVHVTVDEKKFRRQFVKW